MLVPLRRLRCNDMTILTDVFIDTPGMRFDALGGGTMPFVLHSTDHAAMVAADNYFQPYIPGLHQPGWQTPSLYWEFHFSGHVFPVQACLVEYARGFDMHGYTISATIVSQGRRHDLYRAP
jgi:hypothetical protein